MEERLAAAVEEAAGRVIAAVQHRPRPAAALRLRIGGATMPDPVTVNVDVQGESASAVFVDVQGEPTTDAPAGAAIAYASSDPGVVSVDAATGALSFLKAGSAAITATAVDPGGAPLPGIAQGRADLTIVPGPAVALQVSVVEAAPPLPAPPRPPGA